MSRIISATLVFTSILSLFASHVAALGATDTITWGGDNSRSGYQTNHNMDPSVVSSPSFGQLFKTLLPGNYIPGNVKEQVYSQPLTYTGADGIQYVYIATTQNNLYKLDAKTGVILAQRNLHIPFLVADLDGCTDINPCIGITGTGVIDPATDTWYVIAKTYADQTQLNVAQGRPAGRQILHAINTNDLSERPNFPKDLEGISARNNPSRLFNGGIHHQRPALLQYGNFIYAGFGSHCVKFNFTGWIMGWDKTTGETVERFALLGEGVTNQVEGAGMWMSGGGIASDNAGSLFFSTGNGYASQLDLIPVNGRNPPSALEEAVVHMTIGDTGRLTVVDFFMPWEKKQLDGADKDLGTSPLEILPSQFSCGDVGRIGVVTGKSGKTYWLNLDDLGGYRNGPNKLDDILQVYANDNSVYSGAGVYPGEGGYIYINVIKFPTNVFKFSCDAGVPSFTKVAMSPTSNAEQLGVGHGTVTSLNGQAGSGLLWTTDMENFGLRIYNAVPVNGLLTMIKGFNIPYVTKFSRASFGDGRAYVGTTVGLVYGFGSPVNLPLNCTAPNDFGTSNIGVATEARTITCKTGIALTVSSIVLTGNANFNVSGLPSTPLQVPAQGTFSFQASFNPALVGALSSDVLITTVNNVVGYSTSTPVTLRGTGQSVAALLAVTPPVLTFPGAITGMDLGGINQSALFINQGNTPLIITNILYSTVSETGPWVLAISTGSGPKSSAFTFIGLPSVIAPKTTVTVTVNFDTSVTGNYAAYLSIVSNGGTKIFDAIGVAGSPPSALVEFQTIDGTGWVPYVHGKNFTFGNVTENQTRNLKLRVTNNGTADAGSLSLTVSKPPFGLPGIIGAANQVDLAEGTSLPPGQSASANLYCSVPKSQWNVDPIRGLAQWTLNVNDISFVKQDIQFDCLSVSLQSAPFKTDGSGQGRYRYIGCYLENNPGRQLQTQLYGSPNNTIPMCTAACATNPNAVFCGTQYTRECWSGPTIPTKKVDDINCNFACTGDQLQTCGGNGEGDGAGRSYISLFADSERYNGGNPVPVPSGTSSTTGIPTPTVVPGAPIVNPGVGGYTSIGCYTEATTVRALPNAFAMVNRTVSACIAGCASKSFIYAGLEYGQECWCGNAFGAGAVPAPAADCKIVCVGNTTEYCGGNSRLNVYKLGPISSSTTSSITTTISSSSTVTSSTSSVVSTSSSAPSLSASISSSTVISSSSTTTTSSSASATPTGPAVKQIVGPYTFQGCYTEWPVGRTLSGKSYANDSMTLESCSTFCAGSTYFGAEYGRECYCGSEIRAPSALAPVQSDCSILCAGDKTTFCGGSVRIQMYMLSPVSSTVSSVSSSTAAFSSLSSSSTVVSTTSPAVSSSSSVASSTTISSSSSLTATSTTLSPTPSSSSSSSTTVAPTTSSSTTTKTSATATGPTIVPTAGAFAYLGCYIESASLNLGRSLPSLLVANDTMTIQMCSQICSTYKYFGIEYARECFCGNVLNAGSVKVADTDCKLTCKGDASQYCGAGDRLNVYLKGAISSVSPTTLAVTSAATPSSSSATVSSSPSTTIPSSSSTTTTPTLTSSLSSSSSTTTAVQSGNPSISSSSSSTTTSQIPVYTGPPVTSGGNVNFTYYACVSEPSAGKLFPRQIDNNGTSMTIDSCLSTCSQYKYAGVEYGRECYCADTINFDGTNADVPGKNVSDSDCSFTCPGNSSQFCGAGNRINLYWFDFVKAAKNGVDVTGRTS